MTWTEVDSAVTSPAETGIAFSAMKTAVILNCNNLPTQHPHYSSVGSYINEAKDEFMTLMTTSHRGLLDLMPRLHNWRWYDVTVNGQNYLPLPANMLIFEDATYTKLTTAYAPSTTTEYPMFPVDDPVTFGQFTKTSTGWPVQYRRAGSRIEMYPTPSSSPTDYRTMVVVRGVRAEDDLVNAGDTLKMDLRLQKFVIELATAITMAKAGWGEAADRRAVLELRLAKYKNITASERNGVTNTRVAGVPR